MTTMLKKSVFQKENNFEYFFFIEIEVRYFEAQSNCSFKKAVSDSTEIEVDF